MTTETFEYLRAKVSALISDPTLHRLLQRCNPLRLQREVLPSRGSGHATLPPSRICLLGIVT